MVTHPVYYQDFSAHCDSCHIDLSITLGGLLVVSATCQTVGAVTAVPNDYLPCQATFLMVTEPLWTVMTMPTVYLSAHCLPLLALTQPVGIIMANLKKAHLPTSHALTHLSRPSCHTFTVLLTLSVPSCFRPKKKVYESL